MSATTKSDRSDDGAKEAIVLCSFARGLKGTNRKKDSDKDERFKSLEMLRYRVAKRAMRAREICTIATCVRASELAHVYERADGVRRAKCLSLSLFVGALAARVRCVRVYDETTQTTQTSPNGRASALYERAEQTRTLQSYETLATNAAN